MTEQKHIYLLPTTPRVFPLSPKLKAKILAGALLNYMREKEPQRQILPLGRKIFNADKFHQWLFNPKNGYIAKPEKMRSFALELAQQFPLSPLISREMGQIDLIHYFHFKAALALLNESNEGLSMDQDNEFIVRPKSILHACEIEKKQKERQKLEAWRMPQAEGEFYRPLPALHKKQLEKYFKKINEL